METLIIVSIVLLSVLIGCVVYVILSMKKQSFEMSQFKAAEAIKLELQAKAQEEEKRLAMELERANRESEHNIIKAMVQEVVHQSLSPITKESATITEKLSSLDSVKNAVGQLQNVLTNNQQRGAFGEIQLNQILNAVFGAGNTKLFQTQFTIENGKTVDAVVDAAVFPAGEDGVAIPIDSKFPMSGFAEMIEAKEGTTEYNAAKRKFSGFVMDRVKEISNKYIIEGKTTPYAIMFIPSESVYSYIYTHLQDDVVLKALDLKVMISGPSTLTATMFNAQLMFDNLQKSKNIEKLEAALIKLAVDFTRWKARWDKFSATSIRYNKEAEDISKSTTKIFSKFSKITKGVVDEEDVEEAESEE